MTQTTRSTPIVATHSRRRLLQAAVSLLSLSVLRAHGNTESSDSGITPSLAISDGYVVVNGWVVPVNYFRA